MRKLASIVKVGEIRPIPDADRIELATIDGKAWQCVVTKNEVAPDDLAVYFEIDSFLPLHEVFTERLRGTKIKELNGEQGYHLKSIRFRGQLSQGLLLPCQLFSELNDREYQVNEDVTDALGVRLFEVPIPACLNGKNAPFPSFLRKSEQERIQNHIDYFDRFRDMEFEVTIKMDGTSFTAYYYTDKFGVCSRNLEIMEEETNTYWKVAKRLDLEARLSRFCKEEGRHVMIQAELCGEGIQKNRDRIRGQNIFVYDVFDIDKQRYVSPKERVDIVNQLNSCGGEEILHVPILGHMYVFEQYNTFQELQKLADGESYHKKNRREGVVCKSTHEGSSVSFKVISNKYLLKHGY